MAAFVNLPAVNETTQISKGREGDTRGGGQGRVWTNNAEAVCTGGVVSRERLGGQHTTMSLSHTNHRLTYTRMYRTGTHRHTTTH